jgi:hypothetical protein
VERIQEAKQAMAHFIKVAADWSPSTRGLRGSLNFRDVCGARWSARIAPEQSLKRDLPDIRRMTPTESLAESLADGSIPSWFFSLLGWIPAIVFPTATALQLLKILRNKRSDGVSIPAWILFATANVSLFVYTEKYTELESILGTLGTAALNLCIVAAALRYRRPHSEKVG